MTILMGVVLFSIGFIICSIITSVMFWTQLYSIRESLNHFSIQNNTVLANLNNPAVSGLMNHISVQERESGFHNGYNLVILSLFKTFSEDQVHLNFKDMYDAISKNAEKFIDDQRILSEWDRKFMEYDNEDEDDE